MQTVSFFWKDETAATAVEYGLIASLLALAIIASVNGLGNAIKTVFETLKAALTS
jgi:pilus assembly protein Flp/PilA